MERGQYKLPPQRIYQHLIDIKREDPLDDDTAEYQTRKDFKFHVLFSEGADDYYSRASFKKKDWISSVEFESIPTQERENLLQSFHTNMTTMKNNVHLKKYAGTPFSFVNIALRSFEKRRDFGILVEAPKHSFTSSERFCCLILSNLREPA